jgi:hypothetical protein
VLACWSLTPSEILHVNPVSLVRRARRGARPWPAGPGVWPAAIALLVALTMPGAATAAPGPRFWDRKLVASDLMTVHPDSARRRSEDLLRADSLDLVGQWVRGSLPVEIELDHGAGHDRERGPGAGRDRGLHPVDLGGRAPRGVGRDVAVDHAHLGGCERRGEDRGGGDQDGGGRSAGRGGRWGSEWIEGLLPPGGTGLPLHPEHGGAPAGSRA